jgi:superfamily II DNA/RNA helicase
VISEFDQIVDTVPEGPLPSFAELGLSESLLDALSRNGVGSPFPIQAATLPDALAGRDVLGRAQTGSGKTLAFGLALLSRLEGGRTAPKSPRALVLVPTRELAMQVSDALTPYARALGMRCRIVVGGTSFVRQVDALRNGVDLLIATPGRLSDHVRQGTAILSDVAFAAIDEADQMADMGFLPQVREILDLTDRNGQRLLFSATLDGGVGALVREYLHEPVTHSVAPATASVTTMEHHVLLVAGEDKQTVVNEVAAREGRTIMFVRTKHQVDKLAKRLRQVGVRAGALHGGKAQSARTRILGEFKEGTTPVLVATDVAARGIHVEDVSLVVHVDPPADHKDYLHRAGRTARAGAAGVVVTLATMGERRAVFNVTSRAGVKPSSTKVRPGDAELQRITGAREPSGEPVADDPEPRQRPGRSGGDARRGGPRGGGRGRFGENRGESRGRYGERGNDRGGRFGESRGEHRGADSRGGDSRGRGPRREHRDFSGERRPRQAEF